MVLNRSENNTRKNNLKEVKSIISNSRNYSSLSNSIIVSKNSWVAVSAPSVNHRKSMNDPDAVSSKLAVNSADIDSTYASKENNNKSSIPNHSTEKMWAVEEMIEKKLFNRTPVLWLFEVITQKYTYATLQVHRLGVDTTVDDLKSYLIHILPKKNASP